jgi:hypothetical protein
VALKFLRKAESSCVKITQTALLGSDNKKMTEGEAGAAGGKAETAQFAFGASA